MKLFFCELLHGLRQIEINKHLGVLGVCTPGGYAGMISLKWLIKKYPINDKVSDQML